MKGWLGYGIMIYIFAVLQTVLLPELFGLLGARLSHLTIDFFLLLVLYVAFNRDFFHGLIWVFVLILVEKGMGFIWPGVLLPITLLLFLLVQALKVQFVFHTYGSIRLMVFCICVLEHFLHIYLGTDLTLLTIITSQTGLVLISALLHAIIAPYLFEALTSFDAKTIYQFEKQRTLFTSQIRSL